MGLDLNQKCLNRLTEAMRDALAEFTVTSNVLLNYKAFEVVAKLDAIIPAGKVKEKLSEYIGDQPFSDFIIPTLHMELSENQEYDIDGIEKPIDEIEGYEDLNCTATRLVNDFNSLPWNYALTFPLPESLSKIFCEHYNSWIFSDNLKIVSGDLLEKSFSLVSGIKKRDEVLSKKGLLSMFSNTAPQWELTRAYIQIQTSGFLGKYSNGETLQKAVDTVRAFFGLAIGHRLLKQNHRLSTLPRGDRYYIHRSIGNKWVVEQSRQLEARYANVMNQLEFDDIDGNLKTGEQIKNRIGSVFGIMNSIFQSEHKAKNLLLGAQWLLDSFSGSDELLKFVQAAVVVEILLGDKASSDQTGLGELLANRCAYLIANSHSQRLEILENFRKIYEVRSKIVHRGKNRLATTESILFSRLHWVCFRIIQEESKLIEKG